jgi:hypothetical protein
MANKHERRRLRANECVGIFDGLNVRSAFAPSQARSWRHLPGASKGPPNNIFRGAAVLRRANAKAEKASIE